jgi:NAD(P)-dependent dehydrogenase (short-subunit alcohol dehydrogenase family)
MDIAGRTAFITGGASGLGAATARMVHGAGGNVVLADVQDDKGQALAKELGSRALAVKADVTSPEQVAAAVEQGAQQFGALHFAICCAGLGPPKRVLGRDGVMPLDFFTRIIDINLNGTFNSLRLAAEVIAKNAPDAGGERGVVVMTASVAAYDGQIGQAGYSASKGGIVSMTLPIAREFAQLGIRVMTIAPGLFDTPLMAGLPDEARKSLAAQVPFPSRLGAPEEYAELVREIIALPMLNGTTIRLDGAIRMAPR